jgi:hypothetical protein
MSTIELVYPDLRELALSPQVPLTAETLTRRRTDALASLNSVPKPDPPDIATAAALAAPGGLGQVVLPLLSRCTSAAGGGPRRLAGAGPRRPRLLVALTAEPDYTAQPDRNKARDDTQ